MTFKKLYSIISRRIKTKPKNSYVSTLVERGGNAILQKIGEESTEVIIAAKSDNKQRIVEEVSDLYFMTLIFLAYKKIPINKIFEELEKRNERDPSTRLGMT